MQKLIRSYRHGSASNLKQLVFMGGIIVQSRLNVLAVLPIAMLLVLTACGKFFVSPDALVTMSLSPQASLTASGQTVKITATGTDGNNNSKDVSSSASWSSSNSGVATVAAGVVTAGSSTGSTTITAVQDGITGTATITVTASPLASLAIAPTTTNYPVSQGSQQFSATGTLENNNTIDLTNQVAWSSSNTSVATISTSGLVTFVAAGSTTITAKINNGNSTTTATVNITLQ
jgi:trimeric autotransporter adhesin